MLLAGLTSMYGNCSVAPHAFFVKGNVQWGIGVGSSLPRRWSCSRPGELHQQILYRSAAPSHRLVTTAIFYVTIQLQQDTSVGLSDSAV